MRLIDADNLHLNLWVPSKNNAIVKAFENSMIDALNRQPTVEAIPVEWIDKWLDDFTGTKDGDDITELADELKWAIYGVAIMRYKWRKENGTDRQR